MNITFHAFMAPAGMAMVILSASCQTGTRPLGLGGPIATPHVLHEWHDDGGPGKVTVRISLPDQIAEFQRGGRPIGWCCVATGKPGHGTSPGSYSVMEKIVDKYSSFYGSIEDGNGNVVNGDATPGTHVPPGMVYVPAPMPYWLRLSSGGIGMHGGIIPVPGMTASHGCIRMPKDFAPVLYSAVQIGTPVTISSGKSQRGSLLEQAPSPAPSLSPPPTSPQWVNDRRLIDSRPL